MILPFGRWDQAKKTTTTAFVVSVVLDSLKCRAGSPVHPWPSSYCWVPHGVWVVGEGSVSACVSVVVTPPSPSLSCISSPPPPLCVFPALFLTLGRQRRAPAPPLHRVLPHPHAHTGTDAALYGNRTVIQSCHPRLRKSWLFTPSCSSGRCGRLGWGYSKASEVKMPL